MSKPFDVTLKELIAVRPMDWLKLLGLPGSEAILVDADLATVSTEADKVLRIDTPNPYIAHIEFQSSYEEDMMERFLRYHVLLRFRHKIPVRTTIILLRREADRSERLTGLLRQDDPESDEPSLLFRYYVIRLWEIPVEWLFSVGSAVLPLVPLSRTTPVELPALIERTDMQLKANATVSEQRLFWTSTYILMGLKYPVEFANDLLRGVQQMTESVTYQYILEQGAIKGRTEGRNEGRAEGRNEGRAEGQSEGRVQGARETILRQGKKRFGEPDSEVIRMLNDINDFEALEQVAERLLEVESWAELLPVRS